MVRILTDSTADLTHEDAAALGVTVVPLTLNFGDEHYLDGVDLTPEEFFERLETAEKLPTTSQPTPESFLTAFEAARDAGDELVCVLLSSTLSGTFQSATIAKEEAGYDGIYLVDSKNVTLATQLLVRRAVDLAASGKSGAEIAADLESARERLHLIALVDTLKYLHKGGRLSGAAAIAGGLTVPWSRSRRSPARSHPGPPRARGSPGPRGPPPAGRRGRRGKWCRGCGRGW